MAETPSSVSSELSSHSDNEFPPEMPPSSPQSPGGSQATVSDHENDDVLSGRPAKRRRTARARTPASRSSPVSQPIRQLPGTDVSSDSETSLPPLSPKNANAAESAKDEFTIADEFAKTCRWDGCDVGDLGNQDNLVQHVLDVHAGQPKPKAKCACEWVDCRAKGKTQMSAYALRAHMRSHTKEKPFYCELPECDKSFTRSDALSKHMRTVHENENPVVSVPYSKINKTKDSNHANGSAKDLMTPTSAPSPVPKSDADVKSAGISEENQPTTGRTQKLKLVLNASSKSSPSTPDIANGTTGAPQSPLSPSQRDEVFGAFPADLEFTTEELDMRRDKLFRLLRRQVKWAEEEGQILQKEIEELEKARRTEWAQKEVIFTNLMEAEAARAEQRGVLLEVDEKTVSNMLEYADKDAKKLPLKGDVPWYRKQERIRRRAEPGQATNGKIEAIAHESIDIVADDNETEEIDEELPGSEA